MKREFGTVCRDVLICACIGAIMFLILYGTDSLHVTFDWWILNGYVEEDIIQHYTGWMAFRDSAWSFPLGLAGNLGYPDGVVISFTDSLPLVSLFFKCISGFLPETFQFFGLYVLACFMLQGIFAGLLVRQFTKKTWGIYGASVLFVCSPILIERAFRHTALASQWLILAALYLYFRARRTKKLPWGFLLLQVLCVGLHPYFVPMVCGILAAFTLEQLLFGKNKGEEKKRNKFFVLAFFLGNVLLAFLTGYVLGVFGSGVSGSAGGFGYYSMNLNALWNPTSLGMESWSAILPVQAQCAGNYDGFNYLGAGVLVFAAMGLIWGTWGLIREKRFLDFCRSHVGLLLFSLFCTLFALSSRVTFQDRELFAIPLPEAVQQLCSVFRASGRMFWPVYELLFLVAVLTAIGFFGQQKASVKMGRKDLRWAAALAVLLALQLYDLSPAFAQKQGSIDAENMTAGSYNPAFYQSPDWQQVLDAYERAELLNYHHDYNLAAFLMKHHMQSNILPANRGDFTKAEERCKDMILELYSGEKMEEDTLYLTNDPLLAQQLLWNLNENMTAYDLGEYTGFGQKRDGITGKEAVSHQQPGTFAAIESGSPDWLYLRGAKENEVVLPATAILEWELSKGSWLCLGEEKVRILSIELYSNEYIRDYIYVQCGEENDLTSWKHAKEIKIER